MAIVVDELAGIKGIQWTTADETATELTKTIVLRGKCDHGELFNNDIMVSLNDTYVGEYGYYAGHSIRYGGAGRIYDEIEITCVDLNVKLTGGDAQTGHYYSRFEAQARTESRPLEEKTTAIGANDETYQLWWNYQLRAPEAETAPDASDQATLKSMTKLSEHVVGTALDPKKFYWAKSNQAVKKGEKVFIDARYPGVQSYGVPMEQVREVVYTRSESLAKYLLTTVGKMYAPIDHTGTYYDGSSLNRKDHTNWLITSGAYSKKTGWYEAVLTYAYANGGWFQQDIVGAKTGVYAVAGS